MQFSIKAVFFDVFGTLVDWRTSIAREAQEVLEPLGYTLDWRAFADAWRAENRGFIFPLAKLSTLNLRNA